MLGSAQAVYDRRSGVWMQDWMIEATDSTGSLQPSAAHHEHALDRYREPVHGSPSASEPAIREVA